MRKLQSKIVLMAGGMNNVVQQRPADVRRLPIFAAVADGEIDALADHVAWRDVKRGQEVTRHLEAADSVFYVIEGALRCWVKAANGREVTFSVFRAGEYFGHACLLAGAPNLGQVTALKDSAVAKIRGDVFLRFLADHPDLGVNILQSMAFAQLDLSARVFELCALEVRYRVHSELVRLAPKGERISRGILLKPAPTHASLAVSVGAAREAVTRELKDLEQAGVLISRREEIVILDLSYLENTVRRRAGPAASHLLGEAPLRAALAR